MGKREDLTFWWSLNLFFPSSSSQIRHPILQPFFLEESMPFTHPLKIGTRPTVCQKLNVCFSAPWKNIDYCMRSGRHFFASLFPGSIFRSFPASCVYDPSATKISQRLTDSFFQRSVYDARTLIVQILVTAVSQVGRTRATAKTSH